MNGDPLDELDDQGDEIASLRAANEKLRGIIRIQDAAIRSGTATLTSEESMAVAWAVGAASNDEHPAEDILRGLLARCATSTREG